MLRNSGDHTTPVPWYGQPDAWYGQPDPWFGQPFVPEPTADAPGAPGRPDRAPQPPARARPADPAAAQAGQPPRKKKRKPKGEPAAKAPRLSKGAAKPPVPAGGKPPAPAGGKPPAPAGAKPPAPAPAKPPVSAPAKPPARSGPAAPLRRRPMRRPARPAGGSAARPGGGRPRQLKLTRRGRGSVGVLVCTVLVAGVVLTFQGFTGMDGPPQPSAASAALSDAATITAPPPLPPAQPTRIRIPGVSIDAPIMNVGLDSRGVIAAPPLEKAGEAAWFKDSVSPGARGSSVIVGHVDNESGPAVFYSLGALKKGSTIDVVRDDGTTAIFTIYGIEVFTKAEFPAKRIYKDTKDPELRVITCGGTYTKDSGYSGNVVVFARMSKTKQAKI
ncbi:class F sortase [Actinacidiphila glaucinigra]|uniref:class F sortase n=1 Tax=Actinacidiphila glaucinigra TaxID=235986 RepID=UPI0036EDFD4B